MDKISVIGKIGNILSDLQKQQEFFSKNHESLNDVEIELFSASANYLAEYAKVLKKFPARHTSMGTAPASPEIPVQPAGEEENIGFRLNFEEDEKRIQQVKADNEQGLQIKEEPQDELPEEPEPARKPAVPEEARAVEEPMGKSGTAAPEEKTGTAAPEEKNGTDETAGTQNSPHPGRRYSWEATPPAKEESSVKEGHPSGEEPLANEERPAKEERSSWEERPASEAGQVRGEVPLNPESKPVIDPKPAPEPAHVQERTSAVPDPTPGDIQKPDPVSPPAPKPEERRNLSLNERYQEKKSTLYEQIAPKQQQQSQAAPIANLGRSIGINERYYFIKTLFQDDKVAFDQAITRIDMCSSLGEALEYVNKSLSGKYNWGRKEEDSRKFYDLLKRRFV